MKGEYMKVRVKTTFSLLLAIMCLGLYAAGYTAQNEFKLKSGAGGNQCLSCHETFRDITKKRFVHTPVKTGQCTGCHNPHTSSHGKLLAEDTNKICHKCHEAVIPPKALSIHKVVLEGSCVKCHDPHAADNKLNLVKNGNDLCFNCHKGMGDTLAKLKFRHNPVEKGCISCHDPHASAKADHLLKNDPTTLCLQCHKPDRPDFVKQHMNYPMAKAGCTSCHDPHGSNTPGMFYDNVHAPVAKKMCNQCHEIATSPTPFKTKKTGFELCRGCHSAMMNETYNKSKMHWPLLDKVGCANCHEPHASKSQKLMIGDQKSLCGKCHSDTMGFQERLAGEEKRQNAAAKGKVIKGALTHQPVQQGNCDACHAPHASDSGLLLKNKSVIELCGTCHDWLKHSSHPIGEKVTDSRNRNIKMDCLSCHRAHGTGYRQLIPFPNQTELCVQCHQQYRR
jgi:predicted CXXCH cytochrome family protein